MTDTLPPLSSSAGTDPQLGSSECESPGPAAQIGTLFERDETGVLSHSHGGMEKRLYFSRLVKSSSLSEETIYENSNTLLSHHINTTM